MASDAQAELQALLAFLTRDAKIPLATAMPKYTLMRQHGLTTPDAIAKSDVAVLKPIFVDDKIVKQVHNAAKRLTNPKKRASTTPVSTPTKHVKSNADRDADLEIPKSKMSLAELQTRTIETNRAPLFLAFALSLAKYTLPDQPLPSRLSIAQAVTSAGAQSKAKYIGLTDSTAEDEGWAEGQPKVRLMGRRVAVMRRHIAVDPDGPQSSDAASHEAFWGIDLDALRKSNGPLVAGKMSGSAGPPVHKPEAARAYLMKSIKFAESDDDPAESVKKQEPKSPTKTKKLSANAKTAEKEEAVAALLTAIDHVCMSWTKTLSSDELDRRAGNWYSRVRPEVQDGQAGWGQRGRVALKAILDFAND